MHPFFYFNFFNFLLLAFFKSDLWNLCVYIRAQYKGLPLHRDTGTICSDGDSSALTTSNGSVMDNYRQAQLAVWRELWPSADRGPLRTVVLLVNSLWDPSFNWPVIGLSISGMCRAPPVFSFSLSTHIMQKIIHSWLWQVMFSQGVCGHRLHDEGSVLSNVCRLLMWRPGL